MAYYILDHHYAKDHLSFCQVVASDRSRQDVEEILVALWFWWEEYVDERTSPYMDRVLTVLRDHFGFTICDRDDYVFEIQAVLDDQDEWQLDTYEIDGRTYEYVDIYWVRERFCSRFKPSELYDKWLTESCVGDLVG